MSTKIRVGQIPYLNSEVFYFDLQGDGVELSPLVPRALSRAALLGEIDAGPIPLVTCFKLEGRFRPLGDYCIGTPTSARSILLFSDRSVEQLDGATVGITGETSTSVQLLKVLLDHYFQVKPSKYVGLEEPSHAYLLIGDSALRNRHGIETHPYMYDLGEQWYKWTKLPFVFARWMVSSSMDSGNSDWLVERLGRSLEKGFSHVDEIANSHEDLDMTRREIVEYILNFHYRLHEEELQSIELFRELMSR